MKKLICILILFSAAFLLAAGEDKAPTTPQEEADRANKAAVERYKPFRQPQDEERAKLEYMRALDAARLGDDVKAREQKAAADAQLKMAQANREKAVAELKVAKAKLNELAAAKEPLALERGKSEVELALRSLEVAEASLAQAAAVRDAAAARADREKEPAEPWKLEITKALERKVSFEFVDTPLTDAVDFLRHVAGVNVIVDPKAMLNGLPSINLRVNEMKLADALAWVCKLSGLQFELRNQSIFISAPDIDGARPDPAKEAAAPGVPTKLRIKLANGNEFEADSSIFAHNPDLLAAIVEQVLGVVERRNAAIPLARDNPARDALLQLLRTHARNEVSIEYHDELNMLLLSGKNTNAVNELYKLAETGLAAARQFAPRERPATPPPVPPVPPPATRAVPEVPKAPPRDPQF